MKPFMISLIIFLVILAAGILLSIYFNSLILLLLLPFGFAWSFRRKSSKKQLSYCGSCGRMLNQGDTYCPSCGRIVDAK